MWAANSVSKKNLKNPFFFSEFQKREWKSKVNKFNLHVTIETIFGVHVSGSRVFFSRLLSNENMDSKKTSEIRVSVYLRDRRV